MTVLQLTRDSVGPDDSVLAPHVAAVHLGPDADLAELAEWILAGDYLVPLDDGVTWVLRTTSRSGPPVAVFTQPPTGATTVVWVTDSRHPLKGVGSLHLERLDPAGGAGAEPVPGS